LHPVKNQHPDMGIAFKNRTLILDKALFTPSQMDGMMLQSYHSVVLRKLFAVFCDKLSLHHLLIPWLNKSISYQRLFRKAYLVRLPI